jgi:hypothetical protein
LTPTFKSKFEAVVWKLLVKHFNQSSYEQDKFKYIQPQIYRTYIPDFKTHKTKEVYLEAKGKLDLQTRKKMIWFRDSNPNVIIIFLFQNPSVKISKKSKTTYGDWATKNGFKWLDSRKDWIKQYKEILNNENPIT